MSEIKEKGVGVVALLKVFGLKKGQSRQEFIAEVRELRESMVNSEYLEFVSEVESERRLVNA